jgi:hypothetical protein
MLPEPEYVSRPVVSAEGVRVGRVDAVLYDPASQVTWLVIRTTRLGARHTLAPLEREGSQVGTLRTEASSEAVRSAPLVLSPASLTSGQPLSSWYRHYARFGHHWPRTRSEPSAYVVDVAAAADLDIEAGQQLP